MNCLFTVKHKRTERHICIYGIRHSSNVYDIYTSDFLVWHENRKCFSWVSIDEFEKIDETGSTFASTSSNGNYIEE